MAPRCWRFAFAFDPKRRAIILCGGDFSSVVSTSPVAAGDGFTNSSSPRPMRDSTGTWPALSAGLEAFLIASRFFMIGGAKKSKRAPLSSLPRK